MLKESGYTVWVLTMTGHMGTERNRRRCFSAGRFGTTVTLRMLL